ATGTGGGQTERAGHRERRPAQGFRPTGCQQSLQGKGEDQMRVLDPLSDNRFWHLISQRRLLAWVGQPRGDRRLGRNLGPTTGPRPERLGPAWFAYARTAI